MPVIPPDAGRAPESLHTCGSDRDTCWGCERDKRLRGDIERIARRAVSGAAPEGQIDFEIDELVKSELSALRVERDALTQQLEQAYGYLSRLFLHCAPQCEALPTLLGVATQIDSYIASAHQRAEAAEASHVRLREALKEQRPALERAWQLLEGLRLGVEWELAPPIKREIATVADHLAALLAASPGRTTEQA